MPPADRRLSDADARRVVVLVVLALLTLVPGLLRRAWPLPTRSPLGACPAGICPDTGHRATGLARLWLGERLDLDRATEEELRVVPGIGPALAARIVADRDARGPFRRVAAVRRVRGIGPRLSARVARFFVVRGER